MSALPSISVIVPARNAESTLADTLESVRAQTHDGWEVVVVDDGSTDGTARVAARFASADGRFRTLTQEPRGVSAARNAAIEKAGHPWLLFLDADDVIGPRMLERVARRLASDPELDLIHTGWAMRFPDGHVLPQDPPAAGEDLFTRAASTCPFPIHTVVVRSALVEAVGRFDPELQICEDWDLWMRCGRAGARVAYVDEVLSTYRMRPGSASTRADRAFRDGLKVVRRAFAPDPRVPDPALEYAAGFADAERVAGEYRHLAWAAGLAVTSGRDPLPWLDELGRPPCPTLRPADVSTPLFISTLVGRGARPAAWAGLWPELQDPVVRFFEAVEEAAGAPGLAVRARHALVDLVLSWSESSIGEGLEGIHDVAIDVTRPVPIDPPAGARRIHVRVSYDGEPIGRVLLPAIPEADHGRLVEAEVARALAWDVVALLERRRSGLDSPVAAALARAVPARMAKRLGAALRRRHRKGYEWAERALRERRFFADVLGARTATRKDRGDGVVDLTDGIPARSAPAQGEVEIRFAEEPVGRVSLPWGTNVSRRVIERTIRRELADELAAAVVRTALWGRPAEGPSSLLARGRARNPTARAANAGPAVPPSANGPGPVAAFQHAAQRAIPRVRDALGRRAISERLPILAYHRIAEGEAGVAARYRVDPATFESHLAFLRERGFASLSIEEWEAARRGRIVLRGKPVLITFDDGYADVFETAWPLLERYGFVATVFLVTDHVGRTSAWDRHLGVDVPLLDPKQIRALERKGCRFGSHTARHASLSALDVADAARELSESRTWLDEHLDHPPAALSYPYGDVDEAIRVLARRAGFRYGFTVRPEPATRHHDLLDLPRIEVNGRDGPADLARKMWLDPKDRP